MYVSLSQVVLEIWSKTKSVNFYIFAFFAILHSDFSIFLQKLETHTFVCFVVSQKVFKVQIYTIPHFKALDQLFWTLAQALTIGSTIFDLYHKISVAFLMNHPLFCISTLFIMKELIINFKSNTAWRGHFEQQKNHK